MAKVSDKHRELLRGVYVHGRDGARTVTAQQLGVSPAALYPLVRSGLLLSFENSERVRGERRVYWREYRLSPVGRAALSEKEAPHAD